MHGNKNITRLKLIFKNLILTFWHLPLLTYYKLNCCREERLNRGGVFLKLVKIVKLLQNVNGNKNITRLTNVNLINFDYVIRMTNQSDESPVSFQNTNSAPRPCH